ncbi:MAG: hypothetical protein WCK58_12760 [Chloroflexota bacterium]
MELADHAPRRKGTGGPVPVYYSPAYISGDYAFDTTRKSGWIADSLAARPIEGLELVAPAPATADQLSRVHTRAYVEAVRTGEPPERAEGNGFSWDPGLWTTTTASTGGVIEAARQAIERGTAGSLSSGLHHAKRDHGDGFCTFNGLAVAADVALEAGIGGVLVLDLDAHCGGGTAQLLGDDDRVIQVDIATSAFDSYPAAKRWTFDYIRQAGQYLPTLRSRLADLDTTGIGLLLYNAGMDPSEVSMGGLGGMTSEVLAEREETVFAWAKERDLPVAFVLAGGYSGPGLSRAGLVDLHRLTLEAAVRNA